MSRSEFRDGKAVLHHGDSRDVLKTIPDNSIDSVVTDPPYALVSIAKRFGKGGSAPAKFGTDGAYARASAGFMGAGWDNGETAFSTEFWAQVYRVLKPGGFCVAFSGTRTQHRMVCAIEDAGFEIRDQIGWTFGSGFPKSHDVAKGIDKAAGIWRGRAGAITIKEQPSKGTEYERTDKGEPVTAAAAAWDGWGSSLKPAWEPICLARKPLIGTIVENVLTHGTGALNIDGCRVKFANDADKAAAAAAQRSTADQNAGRNAYFKFENGAASLEPYLAGLDRGRWPANLLHDGSDEVLALFPETAAAKASKRGLQHTGRHGGLADIGPNIKEGTNTVRGVNDDGGSAARFFNSFEITDADRLIYCPKAGKADRAGSKHPTVKPQKLMRHLCRLVTPPGGVVLDPFAGSGSTLYAALDEGFSAIGIEREAEYHEHIVRRLGGAPPEPTGGIFGDEAGEALPMVSGLYDDVVAEGIFA